MAKRLMQKDEKSAVQTAPEEGPKNKIVRNREVDKAANDLAQEHVLPLPPGKLLDWDQMMGYLGLLTPAMWNHVSCYLYRLKPKIRRQLKDPNSPNYIDCLGQPFTLEYFIGRHGGGRYELMVNDTEKGNANQGNLGQLFKCRFDINDVQHPPILNYEELEVDAKENRSYIDWLQRMGTVAIDAKGKLTIPAQGAAASAPSGTTNLSAKDVLGILEYAHKMSADQQAAFRSQFSTGEDSLSKSVGQILVERMKQDDPGRDTDRMMMWMKSQMELVEKLMGRDGKPDSAMTAILTILQSQISNGQEQRKTDLEYMKLLVEKMMTDNRRESPRSQLTEMRDIVAFVREIIPGAGGGRRNGWDTALDIGREVVLPLGSAIANIMALRTGGAAAPVVNPGARPPVPTAFDPYRNPGAARAYAQSMPQEPPPQPAPAGPMPMPVANPADPESQLLPLLSQYGGLIVNHLNSGTPGYDFADYVAGLLGMGTHAQIIAPGENVLVTVMLKIPEIAIFGESRIRTFVNEFVHYQEYMEAAGAEEEEVLEAPQQPPARPPKRATASVMVEAK